MDVAISPDEHAAISSLTAANLSRLEYSADWAGALSETYLCPFTADAFSCLPLSQISSPPPALTFKGEIKERPLNVLIDFAWGSRFLSKFGTRPAFAFARRSDIQAVRKPAKRHGETDGQARKRLR